MSLDIEIVLNIDGEQTEIQVGDLFQINFHGKEQCYITWHRGTKPGTFIVGKDKIFKFKTPKMTKVIYRSYLNRFFWQL